MGLTYHHAISVAQLIVFVPCFFLAAFLVFRLGIRTSAGFIFVVTFTLTRIVGACCDLATIAHPTLGLYIAAAVCSSIGLAPLILLCSGMLSRANESVRRRSGVAISDRLFGLLRLLTIASLVLSVVGLTKNMTEEAFLHPDVEIKAGIAIIVVAWAQLCVLLAVLIYRRRDVGKGEHRLLGAVSLCAVIIFVRLLYAMLCWFSPTSTFNLLDGNVTVELVMSVLEEFAVVIICLAVGMTLQRQPPIHEDGQHFQSLTADTTYYSSR
ncbi:hypothetical protein ASPZODRAFT_133536 [Penicilliopsis zonata CBS 506.65]|uniref:DUF7702 domain-containing protein n=1 Tax=Penicilliopsis zonata CBS 506.65 TaxID=1073090 RepID=A0A1L9SES1_9EURO|nr:hypothetical protein ASPZODRAFT_133536 [Penicilliopsis zonata CBS 506.65]OJJ45669.1 hypothetical protein ASPZODRAFT_133536 [Penicilliopsis zonata CBS 506.65]